jgi:hypothetical protein
MSKESRRVFAVPPQSEADAFGLSGSSHEKKQAFAEQANAFFYRITITGDPP